MPGTVPRFLNTISSVDLLITSTGGTGVSITIKDPAGNVVTGSSGLTALVAQYVPIGYKINFGAFSAAPVVTVSGN